MATLSRHAARSSRVLHSVSALAVVAALAVLCACQQPAHEAQARRAATDLPTRYRYLDSLLRAQAVADDPVHLEQAVICEQVRLGRVLGADSVAAATTRLRARAYAAAGGRTAERIAERTRYVAFRGTGHYCDSVNHVTEQRYPLGGGGGTAAAPATPESPDTGARVRPSAAP